MDTLSRYTSFEQSNQIYETMVRLGAVQDYKVRLIHFDHLREDFKLQKKKIQNKNLADSRKHKDSILSQLRV